MSDKPVLFVTNHVPPDRVGAFAALHARTPIELALFGGRNSHATAGVEDPGVPHVRVEQKQIAELAASGRYRAVIAGTAGRIALPSAYIGARRGDVPFVLWTALWAQLRTPALLPSIPLLAHLYRSADAVMTYGEHVSAYVRARGARHVHVAPQAVDNAFWSASGPEVVPAGGPSDEFRAVFAGRAVREKGLGVLVEAWRASSFDITPPALVLVGVRQGEIPVDADSAVRPVGPQSPQDVRNFFAGARVCIIASIPTANFREPWGLVANEAMNQGLPIIATDAVGAAAGGLVRDGRNGLVVPAGDAGALRTAVVRLHDDPALCARLGANAARDVRAFTYDAWADGVTAAIETASHQRKGYR